MLSIKTLLSGLFISTFFILIANASGTYASKEIGDWTVVRSIDPLDGPYCYMFSSPYRTKAYADSRDGAYLLIANKGMGLSIGAGSAFELSTTKGYILKVNQRSHLLNVSNADSSNTYSAIQDKAILNDMIKDGSNFQIRSYSNNDQVAVDYYSLKGFTDALKFTKACN